MNSADFHINMRSEVGVLQGILQGRCLSDVIQILETTTTLQAEAPAGTTEILQHVSEYTLPKLVLVVVNEEIER